MIARRAVESSEFLESQVRHIFPKSVAPYSLAVKAAPVPNAVPKRLSNWPGKNNNKGPKPKQTMALMIKTVFRFISFFETTFYKSPEIFWFFENTFQNKFRKKVGKFLN